MRPQRAEQQKIVCDACHYMEDVDRLHKGLINKKCPDCQSNMLTAEDYRAARRVVWKLRILSVLSRAITRMYPASVPGTMSVRVQEGKSFAEFHRDQHL